MLRNLTASPQVCTKNFNNRLVVITGATSGIGRSTAIKYASHGANILCINRNDNKSKELCNALEKEFGVDCNYLVADFSRLKDIHSVAKQLSQLDQKIDVLIHNAGVYNTQKLFTEDNLETVFQTNYLSSFILNYSLREKLKNQQGGRILFVNSEAHRFAAWGLDLNDLIWEKRRYSGLKSYGASKLAQLLSMIKLNEYFLGSGVTINAMHPGNIQTNSGQNNGYWYKITKRIIFDRGANPVSYAADALYFLGVSDSLKDTSGMFFNLTTPEEPAPPAMDRDAANDLWDLSLSLGGFK